MINVEDLIVVFIIHIILHCQSYHVISPSPYLHVLGECIQFLVANRMDMMYELMLHRTLFSLVKTFIPFVNDSNQPSSLFQNAT